jgi:hypothetical protein
VRIPLPRSISVLEAAPDEGLVPCRVLRTDERPEPPRRAEDGHDEIAGSYAGVGNNRLGETPTAK